MWRDWIRHALVACHVIPPPDFVIRFHDRQPNPEEVPKGLLVVVIGSESFKWACMRCPGSCGHRLQLSLSNARRPKWRVATDWLNRPSLDPSVRVSAACCGHFWLKKGTIEWCSDSKCKTQMSARQQSGRFAVSGSDLVKNYGFKLS